MLIAFGGFAGRIEMSREFFTDVAGRITEHPSDRTLSRGRRDSRGPARTHRRNERTRCLVHENLVIEQIVG